MPNGPSETLHTVVITAVKDAKTRDRVAHVLTRVTRDISQEYVLDRMSRLPWTISRRATAKKARRLVNLLERVGATVEVTPPLEEEIELEFGETQVLPESDLLTGTQMLSAAELVRTASAVTAGIESGARPAPERFVGRAPYPESFPPGAIEMSPLSLGGILDRSFEICRAHFWKLLTILVIPWLINLAVILAVVASIILAGFTARWLQTSSTDVLVLTGVLLVPSILFFLVALFYLSQGALIHAVSDIYLGGPVIVSDSYRFVLSRLGRYFLTSCLLMMAVALFIAMSVGIGAALFFLFRAYTSSGWWSALFWLPLASVPFYGTVKLMLFDKVVIVEDVAYFKALGRSWSLLSGKAEGDWPRGYFLRLLILISLFALIYVTVALFFQAPATAIDMLSTEKTVIGTIIGQVLSHAGSLAASVFVSVCMVVFYYDIRNRKEGFDLRKLSEIAPRT